MRVSPRQLAALEEICDTFCPSQAGLPNARQLGVANNILAASEAARPAERQQLSALLSAWDTPLMGLVAGAGMVRFSAMTPEQRAQALRTWGDSRVPQRRAVFQALRKAALLFYYIVPADTGGRNPAWDAIGYDGPLGQLPDEPPPPLRPIPIERDTTLD